MTSVLYRVLFSLYAVFLAFMSLRSMAGIELEHSDKFFHFVAYGVFAVLGFGAVRGRKTYIYLCLAVIAYGGLMEVAQSFTPGRMMSAYDFLANALGVVIGAYLAPKIFSFPLLKSNNEHRNKS